MHIGRVLKTVSKRVQEQLGAGVGSRQWWSRLSCNDNRNYSAPAYCHQVGEQPLAYRNLGQHLQRAVEQYGQRLAVISCHENLRLTYAEVQHEAEKLATHLRALDLQSGDHLGIWAPNTIQWFVGFLAAAVGGFPLVCINPALQAPELMYTLRKARVKMLITMDECGQLNFQRVLKEVLPALRAEADFVADRNLPELRSVVMKSAKSRRPFVDYDRLMAAPVNAQVLDKLKVELANISPEAACNIQFSSGTTGQPKAALLTHFNYVNVGRYFGKSLTLHESHKHVCVTVPLFHAFALGVVAGCLDYGATMVLPSATFDGAMALKAVEDEGCNIMLGTPTMYVDMIEHQQKYQRKLHSLEVGIMGGASCSPELVRQSKSVLGLRELRIGYGQTESTSAIFVQDGTEPEEVAGSTVGKLFEHGEAKVVDDQGRTVAFGKTGELCVRGYFTMRGYFEDEATNKEAFLDGGWLKTGDEFILEPSGVGRVVGRKKELIIRGGENIFPREIEDFLVTHMDIVEAQVIGVPDKRMGEELCAYVRLRSGAKEMTVDDVKQFCHDRIAHFKIPRYVRVVEQFPKTNSGKIQKFRLLELFKSG